MACRFPPAPVVGLESLANSDQQRIFSHLDLYVIIPHASTTPSAHRHTFLSNALKRRKATSYCALVCKSWLRVTRRVLAASRELALYAEAIPHFSPATIDDRDGRRIATLRANPILAHCLWVAAFHDRIAYIRAYRLFGFHVAAVPCATVTIHPQSISILFDVGAQSAIVEV